MKKNYRIIFGFAVGAVLMIILACIIFTNHNGNDEKEKNTVASSSTSDTTESSTTKPNQLVWSLILVNSDNPLPDDYEVDLKELQNGHAIDERAYSDLQEMMNDCRAEGLEPLICSSYRTLEKQKALFNNKVDEYISDGYSQEDAKKKAGELVAVPGTSEHQLGLALDIVDISYQILDERQEDTPVQKWLLNNSWRYGFILRYPTDKSEMTGISYEPWHYRYVGKEAAKEIYDQGICLEEYLDNKKLP